MLKDATVVYLRLLSVNLPGALARNPRRLLFHARVYGPRFELWTVPKHRRRNRLNRHLR